MLWHRCFRRSFYLKTKNLNVTLKCENRTEQRFAIADFAATKNVRDSYSGSNNPGGLNGVCPSVITQKKVKGRRKEQG